MIRKKIHIPQPGERFGRLVVLRKGEDYVDTNTAKHKSRYWCKCDCGSPEKLIRGANLVDGSIKSCGCLHREAASETAKTKISHGKKYNVYNLEGKYGIGYTSINEEFYFDLEDYNIIKKYWWVNSAHGYLQAHLIGEYKSIHLHQLIMPNIQGLIIDHKNPSMKNDNRKSNLRLALQEQNTRNRRSYTNNLMNGITLNENNKYVAKIVINRTSLFLGAYTNLEDAVRIRLKAEVEFFGEYSCRDIHDEYQGIKKEILKLFKPVHCLYISNTEDFKEWLENKKYFDDECHEFVNEKINSNTLSIVDYFKKYNRMEFYFRTHESGITVWGYYGLVLKNINNSCLVELGLLNNINYER